MAIDYSTVVGYIVKLIGQIVYGIIGIGSVLGMWYFLFVIKKRRSWLVDVYEQKSDGKLYLVDKDRLLEKKINKGKQTIFVFKKTKTESIPPPYECVSRLGNREYCDYVRILGEYVPMEKKEKELPDFHDVKTKSIIFRIIKKNLKKIRDIPTTLSSSDSVKNKFCYVPLHKALKYDIDFKPISYDVNMMRINEIDSLDKMFENKKTVWERYGAMITVGALVAGVIVVTYLSYQYSREIVQQSLGAANQVVNPLKAIAEKLGGSPPVT